MSELGRFAEALALLATVTDPGLAPIRRFLAELCRAGDARPRELPESPARGG